MVNLLCRATVRQGRRMMPTPEERKQQSARNRAAMLEGCEARFKEGEAGALLKAVEVCGTHQPLPEWAARAFKEKYRAVVIASNMRPGTMFSASRMISAPS